MRRSDVSPIPVNLVPEQIGRVYTGFSDEGIANIRKRKRSYYQTHVYAKQELPKSEMLQFYDQLLKYGSFKVAAKYSGCSRAAMYRYKNRFKKIGITERHLKPVGKLFHPESAPGYVN